MQHPRILSAFISHCISVPFTSPTKIKTIPRRHFGFISFIIRCPPDHRLINISLVTTVTKVDMNESCHILWTTDATHTNESSYIWVAAAMCALFCVKCMHAHTCTHTRTHTHTHAHIHTHTHTHTRTQTHVHMHTHATHTHAHMHSHTCMNFIQISIYRIIPPSKETPRKCKYFETNNLTQIYTKYIEEYTFILAWNRLQELGENIIHVWSKISKPKEHSVLPKDVSLYWILFFQHIMCSLLYYRLPFFAYITLFQEATNRA